MKHTTLLLMLISACCGYAQHPQRLYIDSLLIKLAQAKNDTQKVYIYYNLLNAHHTYKPDEGFQYEQPALVLAEKLNWEKGIVMIKSSAGRLHYFKGNFDEALKRYSKVLFFYEQLRDSINITGTLRDIGQAYADGGKYPEALDYFSKALKIAEATKDFTSQAGLHSLLSWVYAMTGKNPEATKENLASLKICEQIGDLYGIAVTTSNLANYYYTMGNYDIALQYYNESTGALKKSNDYKNLSSVYTDIGRVYQAIGEPDAAMKYFQMSLDLATEINDIYQIAFANESMGDWNKKEGDWQVALQYFLKAAENFRAVSRKQELAGVLSAAGTCYTRLRQYKEAKTCFIEAQQLTDELKSAKILSVYAGEREILDSALGNWKNAYFNYKLHILTRDSMENIESNKKSIEMNMQYEYDKKEAAANAEQEKKNAVAAADLKRQKMLRNSFVGGFTCMLLFAGVFFTQRNRIKKGKKRSDELLLNILPGEVAEELKEKGSSDARQFEEVSVLFTDFKNFTKLSARLSAHQLVKEIDFCFSQFDKIVLKYGIEKIKTIGDAYMCAGGLPVPSATNAEDTVGAAMEILDFMLNEKQKRQAEGKLFFELRIGVHTGPVVAGIVGIKKFAYDIWGETVNIASRMETGGVEGKVNISGATYERVKEKFHCTYRGKISAKNIEDVDMYFVERNIINDNSSM